MKDKRAWAPVDIGYLENPKMIGVLLASGNATLMHLASILYCAQHLTDGHVAPAVARMKAGGKGTDEDVTLLLNAGLWHEQGHDCEDCPQPSKGFVYVHNFLEHNRTAAKVKEVSQKRSDAAKARWSDDASEMQSASKLDAKCNAERDREIERDKPSPSPLSPLPGFAEFWAAYPKKVAKQAAIKAWNKAARITDAQDIINGAERYALHMAREKTEKKYIKSPDGWLNAGRWEDELATTSSAPTKNPLWDA